MLGRIISLSILITLSSCALFGGKKSLQGKSITEVLDSIQMEGEGKGRLSLDQHQYLFSYEAGLNETQDWLLGMQVPLHGEEVLTFADLKKKEATSPVVYQTSLKISRERFDEFGAALRSLLRLVMSAKLGLHRSCSENLCEVDGEKFEIQMADGEVQVNKKLSQGYVLRLVAENLTGPVFKRSNFSLHSQNKHSEMALELFWE